MINYKYIKKLQPRELAAILAQFMYNHINVCDISKNQCPFDCSIYLEHFLKEDCESDSYGLKEKTNETYSVQY